MVYQGKNLPKYGVTADEIPPEGMDVMTQPDGKIMIAIPTSKEMQGAVETDWASLKLNAPETQDGQPIPHGDGDYILIPAVLNPEDKTIDIDYECGDARVVNGSIMDVLYQEIEPDVVNQMLQIASTEKEQSALGNRLEAISEGRGASSLSGEEISRLHDQYAELSSQLKTEKEKLQDLKIEKLKVKQSSLEQEIANLKAEHESLDFSIEMQQSHGKSVPEETFDTWKNQREQLEKLSNRLEAVEQQLDKLKEAREAERPTEKTEEPLHIEITGGSADSPQVMKEDGEIFLNYFVFADDQTMKELCERTPLLQENGFESFEELLNSMPAEDYVNMYVNVSMDANMEVNLEFEGKEYPVRCQRENLIFLKKKWKKPI